MPLRGQPVLLRTVLSLLVLAAAVTSGAAQPADRSRDAGSSTRHRLATRVVVPEIRREFRGVWVATVANIDWPSKRTLTTDEQKAELIRLLDKAKELKLNAIIFQVRPQCDALYQSSLEPWSEFLTGRMGQAPSPLYDPLEFAVAEAHARGLELHAWFNPYRASHPSALEPPAPDHISVRRPDLAKQYGRYKWLDPGEPEVQDYSFNVVMDVVRRYDIDGVHFDDYFYPYVERDANNQPIPFPDDAVYQRYVTGGGTLGRADWRRENVNAFIRRVYQGIKAAKPQVKFGLSPFGIWQPGNPPGITGMNAYAEIYADSRRWLGEGWVDYFTPQLYWPINQAAQSYTALLDWWIAQNAQGRHLWPGNAVYRIDNGAGSTFPVGEIINQIEATRERPGSTGNVHFSMAHFLNNRGGISDALKAGAYAQPALVPASPWLYGAPPGAPVVARRYVGDEIEIRLKGSGVRRRFAWVVSWQDRESGEWETEVLPVTAKSYRVSRDSAAFIAVTAVDRAGQESRKTILEVRRRR